MTHSQFAGNIAAIVAALLFQKWLKAFSFVQIFGLSTLVRLIGFVPEMLTIYLVGSKHGEILYPIFYVLGNEICNGMAYSFQRMAMILMIMAQREESFMLPFMFGFNSMGYAFEKFLSGVMIDLLGIKTKTTPCNFDNYALMLILGKVVSPVLSLVALWFVLSSKRIREDDRRE